MYAFSFVISAQYTLSTYAARVFYTVQLIYNAADRLTVIARGPHPIYNVLLCRRRPVADGLWSYIQGDNSPGVRRTVGRFLPPAFSIPSRFRNNRNKRLGEKKLFFQRQSVLLILYFRRGIFSRKSRRLDIEWQQKNRAYYFFYVNSGHTV